MSLEISGKSIDEERALYGVDGAVITDCIFDGPADGESALKESRNVSAEKCVFSLRYPFWHVTSAQITDCDLTENCRAALWYCDGIEIFNSRLNGIKALRESRNIYLENCEVSSPELLWKCSSVSVEGGSIESEYPFFECENIDATNMRLKGKYSFQYVKNAELDSCTFETKDAFWHSKNVTVRDSVIKGEYLGWYSENLKLIRCHIVGTQPLCYCKNLTLEECTMENADLAFERSAVNAWIHGNIDSVKNPERGSIKADSIGEIILEKEYCDPMLTKISVK
ncbi:MAG: DUF3737 family protein [Clostridia bacterium]|nr:DUF3737 family protein [Clostridia bacterium]